MSSHCHTGKWFTKIIRRGFFPLLIPTIVHIPPFLNVTMRRSRAQFRLLTPTMYRCGNNENWCDFEAARQKQCCWCCWCDFAAFQQLVILVFLLRSRMRSQRQTLSMDCTHAQTRSQLSYLTTFNGFICHHLCHQCTSDIAHQSIIIAVESRAARVLVGLRALVSQRGSSTMARLRFDLMMAMIRILMMMVMRPLTRTALTWSLVPQRAG